MVADKYRAYRSSRDGKILSVQELATDRFAPPRLIKKKKTKGTRLYKFSKEQKTRHKSVNIDSRLFQNPFVNYCNKHYTDGYNFLIWGIDFDTTDEIEQGKFILVPENMLITPEYNRIKDSNCIYSMIKNSIKLEDYGKLFETIMGFSKYLYTPLFVVSNNSICKDELNVLDGNQRNAVISQAPFDTIDGVKWILCRYLGDFPTNNQAEIYLILANISKQQNGKDKEKAKKFAGVSLHEITNASANKVGFDIERTGYTSDKTKISLTIRYWIDLVANRVFNQAKKEGLNDDLAKMKVSEHFDKIFKLMSYFIPSIEKWDSIADEIFCGIDSFFTYTSKCVTFDKNFMWVTFKKLGQDKQFYTYFDNKVSTYKQGLEISFKKEAYTKMFIETYNEMADEIEEQGIKI